MKGKSPQIEVCVGIRILVDDSANSLWPLEPNHVRTQRRAAALEGCSWRAQGRQGAAAFTHQLLRAEDWEGLISCYSWTAHKRGQEIFLS